MECKLLIPELESERHPDVAVYLEAPKNRKGRTLWRTWVPDLIVEVVSESSRDRDYTEKRDDYWARRQGILDRGCEARTGIDPEAAADRSGRKRRSAPMMSARRSSCRGSGWHAGRFSRRRGMKPMTDHLDALRSPCDNSPCGGGSQDGRNAGQPVDLSPRGYPEGAMNSINFSVSCPGAIATARGEPAA